MTIFGALRIKNETRWIVRVVKAMQPLCERIFVLDDHSDDGTPEFLEPMEQVTVIRSQFEGTDETRDKDFLLQRVMGCVSDQHLAGDVNSPFWVLWLDGDELLDPSAVGCIRAALIGSPHHAFKLPIRYLWNSDMSILDRAGCRTVRTDGVYKTFARPSIFRLFNRNFRFQKTPWGGNFHCSSIPQELLGHAHMTIPGAPVWHLGYNYAEDRKRKYEWYNKLDPHNTAEDQYRHMVIGDEFPAESVFKHAGPLKLEMM